MAKLYYEGINNPLIQLPKRLNDAECVYHLFPILVRYGKRDALHDYLQEHGVGTVIHYPIPPHHQECYAQATWNIPQLSLPITEQIHNEELSLPIGPSITKEEIGYVVNLLNLYRI